MIRSIAVKSELFSDIGRAFHRFGGIYHNKAAKFPNIVPLAAYYGGGIVDEQAAFIRAVQPAKIIACAVCIAGSLYPAAVTAPVKDKLFGGGYELYHTLPESISSAIAALRA